MQISHQEIPDVLCMTCSDCKCLEDVDELLARAVSYQFMGS